jgi:hypothetical protein
LQASSSRLLFPQFLSIAQQPNPSTAQEFVAMKALSPPFHRIAFLTMTALFAALTSSCLSLTSPREAESPEGCDECKSCAKVCKDPTMHALACDLDHLDSHIEKYGSVVIKEPDVWGQARLTKYREEFEAQMEMDLNQFQERLQGSTNRQDNAFFAQAVSLSAAVSGPGATTTYPKGTTTASGTASPTQIVLQPPPIGTTGAVGNAPAPGAAAPTPQDLINLQVFGNPITLPGNTPNFVSSLAAPTATGAAVQGQVLGIGLEPTIVLEQKARYLDHLNQIRRTNEGDDTADSPGYSLNLVRVPVSVLPGKKTRKGHAAEVTITMTPVLSDELLPMTFRNLVVSDLVDQIGVPLTQVLNDRDFVKQSLTEDKYDIAREFDEADLKPWKADRFAPNEAKVSSSVTRMQAMPRYSNFTENQVKAELAIHVEQARVLEKLITIPAITSTKLRRAKLPFPPSQLLDIYGYGFGYRIAYHGHQSFSKDAANREYVHLPDVQGYLQEEIADAYRFLATAKNADLWVNYCTPDLVSAIRAWTVIQEGEGEAGKGVPHLYKLREGFYKDVKDRSGENADSITAALAWAVLVESALLNDQLVQDMRESAAAKGCGCANPGWLDYYMPSPSAEARQSFNDYVRCRWPIHVFALDPSTDDQNLADMDTTRREMQLALSLAFVSGQINANSMTRYARRLDAQYSTIDINRTSVGFSHGEDTFGWRFYPRFQTPDTESNATVFFRDMLVGGPNKDQLLRERRLEPGVRDCVAIVLMPSFVPYVTCDVSSDWLNVVDPKCKEMDCKDAVRLSREVKAIQNCACKVQDADCYRDGELARLMRKADQLAARLPLQTQTVQVPYENTLGGFAMFNNGVTDLAPELYGWYGAPYIDTSKATTLFLMGNHFSVKQTRIIAGGQPIDNRWPLVTLGQPLPSLPNQELLSRQVVRVSIPAGAQTIESDGRYFVDVHIGTPYGVTSHLLIPAINSAAAPVVSGWKTSQVTMIYSGEGTTFAVAGMDSPQDMAVSLTTPDAPDGMAAANVTLTMTKPYANEQFAFPALDYDAKTHQLAVKSDAFLKTFGETFKTKFINDAAKPKVPETVVLQTTIDPLGADKKTSLKKGFVLSGLMTISWKPAPAAPVSAVSGWQKDQVTISYKFDPNKKAFGGGPAPVTTPENLIINLNPSDAPSFKTAKVTLAFTKPPSAPSVELSASYDSSAPNALTIKGAELAQAIFDVLAKNPVADPTKAPADVQIASAVIDFKDDKGASVGKALKVTGDLKIVWAAAPPTK